MIKALRKMFNGKSKNNECNNEDNTNKTKLAASILLLEAAYADDECTTDELIHIHSTLQDTFGLSNEDTEELLRIANGTRETEVDLWQFTNHINKQSTTDEKLMIMEAVWQIFYVDDTLDSHEDYFAHKLANLLRLDPSQMIQAKLKAKESTNSPA